MNRNLYRVVFNVLRGARMVVQETAKSAGKAAGSTPGGHLRSAASAALAFIASLTAIAAAAQIVADPRAPGNQRPTVLTAPNGVPLVNIQTPSAAGVSRNTYRQFDVGSNGVILSNSRTTAQSQLGGYVAGNPWLATGSARVILNEVNSSNPSYLNGPVEIAGQRAEFILANPSGIQVNGTTFINASGVTLTTGTPQFGASGNLERYLVRGGTVTIGGTGMDASSTDFTAILARAVEVNAGLWAQDLRIVTGVNDISADASQVTQVAATAGTGATPRFALDVAAVGGMYAGHIFLVGTEAGLGMRNAGTIQTSAGPALLTGEPGKLTLSNAGLLENSGLIQIASNADITAASFANSGTMQSAASLQIATQGDLSNHIGSTGGTLEGQRVELSSAAGDIDNRAGTIRQTSSAALTVTAPSLSNTSGGFIGAEPVAVSSGGSGSGADGTGTSSGSGTTTGSTGSTGVASGGTTGGSTGTGSTTASPVVSPGALTASAGSILNDGGKVYAGGPITLQTPNVNNAGGTLNVASMAVSGPAFSNAGGTLNVTNSFNANVASLDNAGGTLHAGQIAITTTGDLDNTGGTLASEGDIALDVGGTAHNANGTVVAAGDLSIQAGTLTNSGTGALRAGRDATVTVAGTFTHTGSLTAAGDVTVTAGILEGSATGVLGAGIQADGNVGSAGGDLRVTTAGSLAAHGTNLAAGSVTLQGSSLDLTNSQTAGSDIALTATQGDVRTGAATVATPGTLSVHADGTASSTLDNTAGILSAGQLDLHAANIRNTNAGQIVQTGNGASAIAVTGTLENSAGTIASNGQDLALGATNLINTGGTLQHAGSGTLDLTGTDFSGANGQIVSNGALAVNVTGRFEQDGGTTSARQIGIGAGTLSNRGGRIVQTGTGATQIDVAGVLDNSGGTIASNGVDLNLASGDLLNSEGHIQHAGIGTLDLHAASYDGSGGTLTSNGALVATVAGRFAQDGGETTAERISIDAGAFSNRGGQLIQTGTGALSLQVQGALDNMGGLVGTVTGSGADVDVHAQRIVNAGGRISADGDLVVRTTGDLHNDTGTLRANGDLSLNATGALTNAQGAIEAAGASSAMSVQAATIDNTEGRIANAGTGDTTLTAGTVTNGASTSTSASEGGLIAGNGALAIRAATLANQANGTLASSGAMALEVTDRLTNRGQIASSGAIDFVQVGAVLDNAGGDITASGNLTLDVRDLVNNGGRIATTGGSGADLRVDTQTLSNVDGTIASDRDLRLSLPGDYSNATRLHAGRDLRLSIGGDLTNAATGTLEAVRTLRADVGGQMRNDPGGVVQAQDVDLHIAGTLANTGEITGDKVRIEADAIQNTSQGAITGGDVALGARTLTNSGAQALIGATRSVSLWVTDSLENIDGATIYSAGDIRIAANSVRDADGVLANATNAIVNRAASIEAGGNIEIAVKTLRNERPGVSIQQVQTLDETHHMTMPGWWHNVNKNGAFYSTNATNYFPYEVYYVNPADILESTPLMTPDGYLIWRAVIRTHANDTAFFTARAGLDSAYGHRERIIQTDGTRVIYYLGAESGMSNPDQVPGITSGVWQNEAHVKYWDAPAPAFDAAYGTCTTNCVRFYTQPGYDDPTTTLIRDSQQTRGPSTSLSELARNAHTVAIDDQLAPGAGAVGRIVAGGNIRIDFANALTNSYSDIMAGGRADLIGSAGAAVTNTATTLYRRYQFDGTRIYADGVTAAYTMPDQSVAIGSVSGTISGAQGVTLQGGTVRNVDTAAGSVANIVDQVQLSSGGTPGSPGTTAASAGVTANAATGAAAATGTRPPSVPQTGAGNGAGSGAAGLPKGGLFSLAPAATSHYLYETRPAFANYREWLSSDYLLTHLGLDPNTTQKRLGDGFYEQRLINEQIAQLTGRRYLDGFQSDDTQYLALLNAGVNFAQQYGLRPGIALTAAQMAQLTSDIVWLETQTVTLADGSTQQVLVPKVYLAQLGPNAVKPNGALITGDDVRIEGDSVVNRGGTLGGGGTKRLVVVANADIVNQGGTLQGVNVGLKAGGNIRNETLTQVDVWGSENGNGDSGDNNANARGRSTGSITSLSNVASIRAGNALSIDALGDVRDLAGRISAGGTASIQARGDVRFDAVTTGSSEHIQIGTASLDRASTQAQVGQLSVGADLGMVAGRDLTLVGTQVAVGGNAGLSAGRNLSLEAAESSQRSDRRNDPAGTSYRQTRSETTALGASVVVGGDLVARAGTQEAGDLTLTGSTVQADGMAYLGASGNVAMGAARQTSGLDDYTQSTRKGLLSSKTTTNHLVQHSDTAVTSNVGGSMTAIVAGGNITGEGVRLSGTNGVLVQASGLLDLHEARDIQSESTQTSIKKSGFAGSAAGIPLPIGAGSRDATTSYSNTAVASSITSTNGGVLLQGDGAAILRGVQVDAAEDITIRGGVVSITGATDYAASSSEHYTRGTNIGMSLWHDPGKGIDAKNTDKGEQQATSLVRTTLSGANVDIQATGADGNGGLLSIAGTTVNTPGTLTLSADKLILGTQTTQTDISNTSQGGDWAWQKAKGQGTSDQTTNYNQFNVGTLATPVNSVQVGLGAKDSISALAQQPGMGWIGQIANDPSLAGKVDWAKVEEAHKDWNYSQQGLTPAAAAVVTLVVAYFTAGAASGVGAAAGQTAAVAAGEGVAMAGGGAFVTAAGATISSVVGGAVAAGVGALAGQASVALINNKGDPGGALHDLGSSANVRSLLTAIVTGGVLGGMNLNPTGLPTEGGGAQGFMTQLGQNLQAGVAKALISTAIHGGSLEDSLANSIKTAFIDTAAAQGAFAIGDMSVGDTAVLNDFANKVAHAIAGCAAGTARTDTSGGCSAGAIGAAIGELAAEAYGKKADTTQFAAMMAGIAAAVTGASAQEINLASQAGGNAAANNYLSHDEGARRKVLNDRCAARQCTPREVDELNTLNHLDVWRDKQIEVACADPSSSACQVWYVDMKVAQQSYAGKSPLLMSASERQELDYINSNLDMYAARIANPTAFGVGVGVVKTAIGVVTATVYIGYLAASSIAGDAASQTALKDLVVNAAVTVTDLSAAAQRMMAQADAAEVAGNPSLAAQIRTELVINTALLGYAATQLVRSAGTASIGANGRVDAVAGNGEGLFTSTTRVPYTPVNPALGQAFDFSCAAASCKMAANLTNTPEAYIRSAILTDGSGTSLANIPDGLKNLGFTGTADYSAATTIESISTATKHGASVIVNVKTDSGGIHAIVVDSVKNGMANVRDPWPLGTGSSYSVPIDSLGAVLTGKSVTVRP